VILEVEGLTSPVDRCGRPTACCEYITINDVPNGTIRDSPSLDVLLHFGHFDQRDTQMAAGIPLRKRKPQRSIDCRVGLHHLHLI
jgi:hypothetical protein